MKTIVKEDIAGILQEDIRWEKLKGATVLLTGASGMIGRYILQTLLALNEQGWEMTIYGLLRHPEKLPEELRTKIHTLCQDVTAPVPEELRFDYVIHTASPASPRIMDEDPAGTMAANVLGAWQTLQAAQRSRAKGYLFLSSREVYGKPVEGQDVFTETTYGLVDPLDPRSCYPEGKKAAETMCACFHKQYGIPVRAARLAHTYGPGMTLDDGRVQADFIRDVINNRDIVVKSDGTAQRTYTYVADAVAGLFFMLLNAPEEEIVYNISNEQALVTIRQLAETLAGLFPEKGLHVQVLGTMRPGQGGTAPFASGVLSSGKLQALGWRPRYSLAEGLRRTVQYQEALIKEQLQEQ